jgi:hypothetical protein
MRPTLINLRFSTITGFLLVLPFIILEMINRQNFHQGFPFALFGILWLLSLVSILVMMPVVREIRARNRIMPGPVVLLIRLLVFVFLAWIWTGIVIDQMPCFLGVPNCD